MYARLSVDNRHIAASDVLCVCSMYLWYSLSTTPVFVWYQCYYLDGLRPDQHLFDMIRISKQVVRSLEFIAARRQTRMSKRILLYSKGSFGNNLEHCGQRNDDQALEGVRMKLYRRPRSLFGLSLPTRGKLLTT